MANWKFTDDYLTAFPGLQGSVLNHLVFSDHTITGNNFTGTLDFAATGSYLQFASSLLNIQTLSFTGTVTVTATDISISLSSANLPALKDIPVIGKYIQSVKLTVVNNTKKADKGPATDQFRLNIDMQYNNDISGNFVCAVPVSSGIVGITAVFKGVGIGLSDLNFLLPSSHDFATYFPSDNPFIKSVSEGGAGLELLEIDLGLFINNDPGPLSISLSSLGVSIGIVNIPLYKNALFLNPLAVAVRFPDIPNWSKSVWSISGTLALYPPAGQGKSNPTDKPADFSFEVSMTLPVGGSPFSISGKFDNPEQQSIGVMLVDMFGAGTTIGKADELTITEFDFNAAAGSSGGGIGSFYIDVGVSSQFGIFQSQNFDVEEFVISVDYNKS